MTEVQRDNNKLENTKHSAVTELILIRDLDNKDFLDRVSLSLSHDLRGSLARILGIMQIMDRTSMTEENLKYINWIRENAHTMDKDIQSLVDKIDKYVDK